jgi:hypothetical protein
LSERDKWDSVTGREEAMAMSRYARHLALLPRNLQRPLERNLLRGIEPVDHPALIVALEGDFTKAAHIYGDGSNAFDGVEAFIRTHFPDMAWGSVKFRKRWTSLGGLRGQSALFDKLNPELRK